MLERVSAWVVARTGVADFGRMFSAISYPGLTPPPVVDACGCLPDADTEVLQQQDELQRISWRRFEAPIQAPVEGRRVGGLGVDEQGPGADPVGDRRGLEEGVLDELRAQSVALVAEVHSKASEDDHGNRMSAGSGCQSCRGLGRFDRTRRQGVIPRN